MPLDPAQLRLAMLAVVEGADALARQAARTAARLDGSRVRAQVSDARRLSGKPGASPAAIGAARARAVRTATQARASTALAGRADVRPFPVNAEVAYLHGRVVERSGAPVTEARLRAMSPAGELLSEARTDPRGYFRFEIPANSNQTHSTVDPFLLVIVSRASSDEIIYRDEQPFRIRTGRSRYREIVLASASHLPTHA